MNLKSLIKQTFLYKQYKKYREYKISTLTDEEYFIRRHKKKFGYTPDFRYPKTYNEKIIHRILYDRNPIYTHLADKLKARIYIAHRLKTFSVNGGGESRI